MKKGHLIVVAITVFIVFGILIAIKWSRSAEEQSYDVEMSISDLESQVQDMEMKIGDLESQVQDLEYRDR